MSIKRILVPLPGSASHTGEIEMALSAAKALGAHVQALFISQPPPVTRGGVTVSELGRTASVAEERERTARDAREVFAQACAKVGIPMLSANDEPGSPLAASWREAEGSYVEIAVQRAAAFDLVVAASASVMESLMAIAEQSLLQTRRPVVLAPARLQSDLTDSVMTPGTRARNAGTRSRLPYRSCTSPNQCGSSALIGTPAIAKPRRRRCLPICAVMASVRPRRWLHRNCARWAIPCSRRGQSMKPACWSWAPIPIAACARCFWAGPRATS